MTLVEPTKRDQVQALAAAESCMRLLKERYGVRRVVLFGSLADHGSWHEGSDVDLAVEGLAPADFFPAYSACREVLSPYNLELDLVPLEKAYPEMQARILGEVIMPSHSLFALQALIQDELTALERVAQEMAELLAVCAQPPTRTELRAMASILHEFYNGVERIFERIAIGLGEGIPHGRYGHADLLEQMAIGQEGARPAVIDEPLRARLKEYLDFRHFFRHAYGYMLDWDQLRWKVEALSATLILLRDQLHAFFQALVAGQQANDSPDFT